jgi:branched-chain amino acid transport system permease protein
MEREGQPPLKTMLGTGAFTARIHGALSPGRRLHTATLTLVGAGVVFVFVWVLFWNWKTNFGPSINDPTDFSKAVLDSLTYAGLLFVVASGFTLIFGLMRTVNMAHGSYFLLGGLIAFRLEQDFGHALPGGFGLTSAQVGWWQWVAPALIASGCIAIVGLVTQQLFLRWNQGQDLRQALITIAISVIIGDQLIYHLNAGSAQSIAWPAFLGDGTKLRDFLTFGTWSYSWSRLFMLAVAIGIGIALWLWLQKTKSGMVIRAGVDDRQMVSALGVNIQLTFALAFVVGAALAGFGGVMGGSFAGLQTGVDGDWLLNSLIVVILGGMGSIGGAAVGAVLLGFVSNISGDYLPTVGSNCCTEYSVVLTFALLAAVLALRPLGLFGRPG